MDIGIGLDFYLPATAIKAAVVAAFMTAMALCGLFAYLNRYTRKHYFTVWTVAWLFYALWVLLHLVWPLNTTEEGILIARQCALGLTGAFLLWGSAEFLEEKINQRMMTLFLVFVLVWAGLGLFYEGDSFGWKWPVFALLGFSSLTTALSFYRFRRRYKYIGAGLLAFGFLIWGVFFIVVPVLMEDPFAVTSCFVIMDIIQLFMAASMIVLVLEEVRTDVLAARAAVEAKRSETSILHARVRSSEERYQTLFEQAHEAIIITDEKLRVLRLNASARHLLGLEDQVLDVSLHSHLRLNREDEAEYTLGSWLDFFNVNPKAELMHKDGTCAAVEIQAAPIHLNQRTAIQFLLCEVTEKTRLEQQLRQAEKLSALGQMISGVAHELNNPLASVRGYAQLLLAGDGLSPKVRENVLKIAVESDRAAKLVGNFLAFARAGTARRSLVNLNDVVHETVTLREFEFRVTAVQLDVKLDASLPLTLADKDKVAHALLNLLGNALQALCEWPRQRSVMVRTAHVKGQIHITVADTGPGVAPEHRSRIFEPFFTTKAVGIGTGLGLSVVHGIMMDHGGRASYSETQGGGATFTLSFPVLQNEEEASILEPNRKAEAEEPVDFTGIRVLVLDDEKAIAELLQEMLAMLGCEARMATAGHVALELVRKGDFDLILSDFKMPEMDGEQFYKEVLKTRPELAGRIIFLSGDVISDRTQHFLSSIPNKYLSKPFNLADVQRVMHQVLCAVRGRNH